MQRTDIVRLKTIAVDLTPVLPGGHNGGAKIVVMELLPLLTVLAPSTRFVLLTNGASHEELSSLDSPNVTRLKVVDTTPGNSPERGRRLREVIKPALELIPVRFRARIKQLFQKQIKRKSNRTLLQSIQADLLFCPFTAPTYHTLGIPTVCTFYDVQYKTYPQFFDPIDVLNRDHTFGEACRHATALAAISDYSRISAINQGELPPNRIQTIYLRMAQRINVPTESMTENLLTALGLKRGRFLLYPANFWKHKNHEMLLIAFSLARTQGLSESVILVCTGAPGERREWLIKAADSMGLAKHVILPGYMSDDELSVLLHNSRGMVFPSLYEGFGLPVIEAMSARIPVACSNVTSLPEVAAGAAILFDPRSPEQIASAMHSLVTDDGERTRCIEAGCRRAAEFADAGRMAREYLDIFEYARSNMVRSDMLSGSYPDGWVGDVLHVTISRETRCTAVEFELCAPEWLPNSRTQVQCMAPDGRVSNHNIHRGHTKVITCPAHSDEDVQLTISPCFTPSECSESPDSRQLSLVLQHCTLVLNNGNRKQLYPEEHS